MLEIILIASVAVFIISRLFLRPAAKLADKKFDEQSQRIAHLESLLPAYSSVHICPKCGRENHVTATAAQTHYRCANTVMKPGGTVFDPRDPCGSVNRL